MIVCNDYYFRIVYTVIMNETNYTINNNKQNIIDSNNVNINRINISTDSQKTPSAQSSQNRSSNMCSKTNKILLFILFLISCTLGTLIVLLVYKGNVKNSLIMYFY